MPNTFTRKLWFGGLVGALMAFLAPPGADRTRADDAPLDSPSLGAKEGVLLLRNGNVVTGKILNSGDVYQVERPGGRMSVPAVLVRHEARTLVEVYNKLREGARERGVAEAHLSLARWCITNHLLGEAKRELEDALVLEPEYTAARDMLRRVEKLQADSEYDAANVRKPAETVLPAAYMRDDAESLAGLDTETVREFSRRIQPILMNNCAATGCHHAESQTGFRLQRVASGISTTRNSTERNLAEVLEQIDIESPGKSPLLAVARKNHGRIGRTAFTGPYGQKQLAELTGWVEHAARLQEARGNRSAEDSARRSSIEQVAASDDPDRARPEPSAARLRREASVRDLRRSDFSENRGQGAGAPRSSDPFDPSDFNRERSGTAR